jgi:hypothetical protein
MQKMKKKDKNIGKLSRRSMKKNKKNGKKLKLKGN